jgi:hypothetical protein
MNNIMKVVPGEESETKERPYSTYDDATLERMKRYFRLADKDELLKFIKRYDANRHSDMIEG